MIDLKNLEERVRDMAGKARARGKKTIFAVATAAYPRLVHGSLASLRETADTVAVTLMATSTDGVADVLRAVDGLVDHVMIDIEPKRPGFVGLHREALALCRKSVVLTNKPNDFTVDALDALVSELVAPLEGVTVAILGCGNIGAKAALKLAERGAQVRAQRRDHVRLETIAAGLNALLPDGGSGRIVAVDGPVEAARGASVVIGTSAGAAVITPEVLLAMSPQGLVIDAGTANISPAVLNGAFPSMRFMCLNIRPGYEGAVTTLFSMRRLIKRMGRREVGGFAVISSGIVGAKGDVIVDDVNAPTFIIGVADGHGDLVQEAGLDPFRKNLSDVEKLIQTSGEKPS